MELLVFTIHDYFLLITEKFCRQAKVKEMLNHENDNVLLYDKLVTIPLNETSQAKMMRLKTIMSQDGFLFWCCSFYKYGAFVSN
jgi:hypothetical protein